MSDLHVEKLMNYIREVSGLERLELTDKDISIEGMKKVDLRNVDFCLWLPRDSTYKQIVNMKLLLESVLLTFQSEASNSKALEYLKQDVVQVFESYQEHLKSKIDETNFRFLHGGLNYALLEDNKVIINEGLDDHTINTSRLKLEKTNHFEIHVKEGELYGFATKHFKIIIASDQGLTEIQKGLVNVQLIMLNNDYENQKYLLDLENNKKILERQDRLKNEFLANTTHELKTPIHGIIGLAESLFDGATGELHPETMKSLKMIASSGKRLEQLIDDVLDFAKLKNEEVDLHIRPVDMRQLTEVVLTVLKTTMKDTLVTLDNHIDADIMIMADENRVQQVLYNLIGNSIKFTNKGSVTISATIEDGFLECKVEDTGIGIPKEKLTSVFKSFEQVDGSISREYGGTGLGLSITKFLVELHGGRIWCESEVGVGSSFYFTLPLLQDIALENRFDSWKEKASTEQNSIYRFGKAESFFDHKKIEEGVPIGDYLYRILVVDDEQVNVQVLVNQLKLENYAVDSAPNGILALDMIERGNYDLVLLDVMMPKLSGYEVCKIIRETYSAYELPILMMTAKNQMTDITTGFDMGVNDYLTKPFQKSEMLARVKTLLKLKKSVSEAITNAVLANTDALTDLNNRRFLFDKGQILFNLARQNNQRLCVLMMDVDHLKSINDRYGHDIGDEVIKCIALCIKQSLRERDVVGRYGGEEFTAVLPDADLNQGKGIAERIVQQVRLIEIIASNGEQVPCSISIGIASYSDQAELKELIRIADKKLYLAKTNGRDRYEV